MAKKDDITKALGEITDTLDDINKKLDHIIKKETEDFLSQGIPSRPPCVST
jgi:hypothetical protein